MKLRSPDGAQRNPGFSPVARFPRIALRSIRATEIETIDIDVRHRVARSLCLDNKLGERIRECERLRRARRRQREHR
ncbi:hypothetical protein, partial [Bradyrhizobium pachyrhizi]|uniref:hypothetical protein n=1 Tax=Bradyrhizobium pachyrhizi TaxID=280333 RepID=UPI001AEC63E1